VEEHPPVRPEWDCGKCGQTWPCAVAKSNLLDEYADCRTQLMLYLALQKWDAFDDYATLYGKIPADLDERFTGWVPRLNG
jgi:hypothetical protein